MAYAVKEIYLTLQGEGAHTGRSAVFCRFAGCNLWSGREADRPTAVCQFCDTEFFGTDGEHGGTFQSADDLAELVSALWAGDGLPYVVCTGGEPLLQLDDALVTALHQRGFEVAVETNGTLPVPAEVDWVCVSPKANTHLAIQAADELKLVFPQDGLEPSAFADFDAGHFFLQPMDGPKRAENTLAAVEFCQRHPKWRVSAQMHKLLGIR